MAKLRIRYSAHHDPISWYIRWKSGPDAEHSHVEYLLEDGTTLGARMFGGVKIRPVSPRDKHVVITEIEVDHPNPEEFLKTFIGCGYDFKGLAGWVTHNKSQNDEDFWCSEFIFITTKMLGTEMLHSRGWVSPRDLLLSPIQTEI